MATFLEHFPLDLVLPPRLTHLQKHLARVHVPDQLILRVLLELARELHDELLEHERVEVLAQQEDQEPVPHLRPLHQHVHPLLQ